MTRVENLQTKFLNEAYESKRMVTVYLMNGFQMRGTVAGFDPFVVTVTSDGKQQMIYKHAISTIIPERPFTLLEGEEEY